MTGGDSDANRHRDPASVRQVYDDIASHFSKTREYPWPETEAFVDAQSPFERGLDVGCGNGRNMAVLAKKAASVVGVDVSRNLLIEARNRSRREPWSDRFVQGDAATLPVRAESVDVAVYVATIHHLPNRERRRASLDELARVLRAGGRALVGAWSTEHDRFDTTTGRAEGFDTTVDWTLPDGETVPRFYHIYAPAEFEADLEASGLETIESYVSSGNCYAEVTVANSDGG